MKKVRMLLRVSSDQQLEADGDLSIQRAIVQEYIKKQPDWVADDKEYFEGSKSAYKNTAEEREILQQILEDAAKKEFDILLLYKDDRIGRLMLDTTVYIMSLKSFGVDVHTVKDGCISPEIDDIMGQMMLAFRFANAQKSSADTGMRVKDTAQKLVQTGKFMGGKAPFGYTLEYSGEISKHGRALKHPVINEEQAEVVRIIYDLSLSKEYGSAKIARILNENENLKNLAPNGVWKAGTITSILTNPLYAGHTAYKRRETINGKTRRIGMEEWITSLEANDNIKIIESDVWNKVQEKRKLRINKYTHSLEEQDITVISRNDGVLTLVDVAHCGYCGCKLTNGSKYNYWTIKDTGEKRSSKIAIYKCNDAWQGVPHVKEQRFRADVYEPFVFSAISEYIGKLQEKENIFEEIENNKNKEKVLKERELKKEKDKLLEIKKSIEAMEEHIPDAVMGKYPLSLEDLVKAINKQKDNFKNQNLLIKSKEEALKEMAVSLSEWEDIRNKIPSWQEVFLNADSQTKRVLINKLVERIDFKKDEIKIRFKINLDDFLPQPRMSDGFGVQKSRLQF